MEKVIENQFFCYKFQKPIDGQKAVYCCLLKGCLNLIALTFKRKKSLFEMIEIEEFYKHIYN